MYYFQLVNIHNSCNKITMQKKSTYIRINIFPINARRWPPFTFTPTFTQTSDKLARFFVCLILFSLARCAASSSSCPWLRQGRPLHYGRWGVVSPRLAESFCFWRQHCAACGGVQVMNGGRGGIGCGEGWGCFGLYFFLFFGSSYFLFSGPSYIFPSDLHTSRLLYCLHHVHVGECSLAVCIANLRADISPAFLLHPLLFGVKQNE